MFTLQCPDVGCYQNFQCDPEFQNKIVASAYVRKTYADQIDKTTAESWMLSLQEAYLNGQAMLVLNTSGEKPRPETATGPGRGMQTTKALAKTHTVNYQDMQGVVLENVEFYNEILSSSQNFDFYYFTPGRIWDASGYYVTVIGDPVIGADLNTYQMAEVTVTWTAKTNPLPYEFDTDTFLEGLFYEISGLAAIATTVASGDTTTYTAELTVDFGSAVLPEKIWSVCSEQSVIDELGAVIDATTGELELTPVDAGVYTLLICVTNEYGCVTGQKEVIVTVTA